MPYFYQTVNEYDFVDAFDRMGRADNFSVPARRALFEYCEELAEEPGAPFELDVVAICCDWAEYTAEELVHEYGAHVDCTELADCETEEERAEMMAEIMRDETTVIEVEHFDSEPTYLVLSF